MAKKELVEKFKNEMPEFTGTEEEKELKTALYIYIALGKMKSFDERYYFGNSRMVRSAEREAIEDSKNPDKIAGKRKIICITMSHLYKAILSDFGIESEIITEMTERNDIDHMTNVLKLKNGKRIIADCQLDMYRVQTGLSLNHFGVESEYNTDVIDSDKLTNMLIEIGYIKSKDDYRDEKVEAVRKKIEGLSVNEALRVILNSPEIYEGNENQGEVEAYKYYYSTLKTLMPEQRGKKVYQFMCSKKAEGKEVPDYSFGIYANVENIEDLKVYLYSKAKGRMLGCDLETLIKLEENGLKIGRNGVEKPVKILSKSIKRFKEKQKEQDNGDEAR